MQVIVSTLTSQVLVVDGVIFESSAQRPGSHKDRGHKDRKDRGQVLQSSKHAATLIECPAHYELNTPARSITSQPVEIGVKIFTLMMKTGARGSKYLRRYVVALTGAVMPGVRWITITIY